jgi:hypothetical protein
MKNPDEIDTWIATLEWTPETAESRVAELCEYLQEESIEVWRRLVPRISAGLDCLADNPDELYRLTGNLYQAAPFAGRTIRARILASVNAALPEHIVVGALMFGALMPILANRNYTLSQRLAWLKEYNNDVFTIWGIESFESALETPIKDALALRFYIGATAYRNSIYDWGNERLPASAVSTRQFLEMNAPNLVGKIDLVMTLGLSYANAFDMLIDAGDGKRPETLLDLPTLNDPGRNL